MSYAIDVNILLYASDAESPLHGRASAFLRQCMSGREVFCVAWPSLMSYLRMATHPAIFSRPLAHEGFVLFASVRSLECLLTHELERDVDGRARARGRELPGPDLVLDALGHDGVIAARRGTRDRRRFLRPATFRR